MSLLVTFDWNCILSLENGEKDAAAIQRLVDAHRNEALEVGLLATSASENMRGSRGFPGSFALFEERISGLGLSDLPVVRMPGVWGLTYWGHSYWVDQDEYEGLSNKLWDAIAPSLKRFLGDWSAEKSREPTAKNFRAQSFPSIGTLGVMFIRHIAILLKSEIISLLPIPRIFLLTEQL